MLGSVFASRFHMLAFWVFVACCVVGFLLLNSVMWWLWALLLCVPIGFAAVMVVAMAIGTIRNVGR